MCIKISTYSKCLHRHQALISNCACVKIAPESFSFGNCPACKERSSAVPFPHIHKPNEVIQHGSEQDPYRWLSTQNRYTVQILENDQSLQGCLGWDFILRDGNDGYTTPAVLPCPNDLGWFLLNCPPVPTGVRPQVLSLDALERVFSSAERSMMSHLGKSIKKHGPRLAKAMQLYRQSKKIVSRVKS